MAGYYVMTFGGGCYTSIAWYDNEVKAQGHVDRLKANGQWSGMPPKIEAGDE